MERIQFEKNPALRLLTLSGAGALAVSLAGCAYLDNEKPSVVVSHEYQEEHLVSVSPHIHADEAFILNLEQCGYDPSSITVDEDGCVAHSIEVTEQTYDTIQDGQSITYSRLYEDGGIPVTVVSE